MLGQLKKPILFYLAFAFALSYLIIPATEGSLAFILLKSGCCFFLGLFAYLNIDEGRIKKLAMTALFASCLGDIFLAIRSSDYFIEGLGSFLIAHLLYVSIFFRRRSAGENSTLHLVLCGLVMMVALLMMILLWDHLAALKAPVFIYICVISIMTITAINSRYPALLIIPGTFSFMISDSLIAINKFMITVPFASTTIWITYAGAQILITLALIKGENEFLKSQEKAG
ncbi:MAG: lysoplasmalogenase [Sneathiellales bacterium]|nr:lysoplasmalogenase [Sneathiellales bacterium]